MDLFDSPRGNKEESRIEYLVPIDPEREAEFERAEVAKTQARSREVYRVLFFIFLLNVLVAAIKLGLGYFIDSTALSADGLHSLADSSANIVGIVGLYLANRPRDSEHPYGHGKIEMLIGAGMGLLLAYLGFNVIREAIYKFQHPVRPEISALGIGLLIFSIVLNIIVARSERRAGERLNSAILISDSSHTKTDVIISIGVLISLAGIRLGLPSIVDPIVSLLVAAFVLHAAWEVFSQNANVLIDAELLDEAMIERTVRRFKEVRDVHGIRSRGNLNHPYIDLHLIVDPEMTVARSHLLDHLIEDYFRRLLGTPVSLQIHFEPDLKEKQEKTVEPS